MLAFQAPVMADHVVTIPVQKIDAGMCPPPSPQPTQPCALTEDFYANPALHTLTLSSPCLRGIAAFTASVNAALMRPGRVNSRHPHGRPQMPTYVMVSRHHAHTLLLPLPPCPSARARVELSVLVTGLRCCDPHSLLRSVSSQPFPTVPARSRSIFLSMLTSDDTLARVRIYAASAASAWR